MIPGIDIGNEVVEERALLSSLAVLAEQRWRLPVCCLGLVPHTGHLSPGAGGESGMIVSPEPGCRHNAALFESQRWVQPGGRDFPGRNEGVVAVRVGEVLCGTVGIRPSNGSAPPLNGEMGQFLEHFRARYLRYYLYHHSRRWMARERPVIILGEDPALRKAQLAIGKYAGSFLPVLIRGETGTGKELWARALHLWSDRYERPFLPVNCSHLTGDQMAVSSLFGHRRGSYTGAVGDRKGYFEQAAGGTLFLDEIDSLSPRVQGMLLRAMETGEVHKLGADFPETVNVRLIAATNTDLEQLAARGGMRKDFLYRIQGHTISLPPLRNREPADIITLARFYLHQMNRRFDAGKYLSGATSDLLVRLPWYGNVRELRNAVMTAWFNSESADCIDPGHLPGTGDGGNACPDQPLAAESGTEEHLYSALAENHGDFWETVYAPFMNRDLNRQQVRCVVRRGLREAGSYRDLLDLFNIPGRQYRKFMDFLRNHDLRV